MDASLVDWTAQFRLKSIGYRKANALVGDNDNAQARAVEAGD